MHLKEAELEKLIASFRVPEDRELRGSRCMVFDRKMKHYKETSIEMLTDEVRLWFFVGKEEQEQQASQVTMCIDSM